MTQEEYNKYLDKQNEYMEKVKNYKPNPSYLPPKEQKKIPEKLETYKDRNNDIFLDDLCYKYMPIHKDSLSFNEQVIVDKLNEIIDYFESKGVKYENQ